ncbi:MAG: amidase [Alphaproteobacteria bacterium]|nr:MAG: amidase [Alphaproteobacteria bacterium]
MMSAILTIAEATKRIEAKQLSPVELAKMQLERIRRLDPQLNAFLLVTEDRALADAKAAEARQMSGTRRGRLDGIPIAHKDIYNTAGIRTTAHSRLLEHNVPTRDAHTVKKWADAGTVMLGKLATHEFAFGGPSFDLPWPPARNPWDTGRFTGGSSSGTSWAAPGPIPAGRSADRPRSAASRESSRPTACPAAAASCRSPSASTTPGRWPGRRRIARCCCRAWRATIRQIRPASIVPSPTSRPRSARA